MKKVSEYFNEIMLIALIAFIPMSTLSCSLESIENVYVVNDICDTIKVGKYTDSNNSNIIWYFGPNGELKKFQDGIQFFDGWYIQNECELWNVNEFGQEEFMDIEQTGSGIILSTFFVEIELFYEG